MNLVIIHWTPLPALEVLNVETTQDTSVCVNKDNDTE